MVPSMAGLHIRNAGTPRKPHLPRHKSGAPLEKQNQLGNDPHLLDVFVAYKNASLNEDKLS